MPGDLLDDLHEGEGIHLAAVEEAGQQQAEKGGIEERPKHGLGQPALLLGLLAQVLEQGSARIGRARHSAPRSRIPFMTPSWRTRADRDHPVSPVLQTRATSNLG